MSCCDTDFCNELKGNDESISPGKHTMLIKLEKIGHNHIQQSITTWAARDACLTSSL